MLEQKCHDKHVEVLSSYMKQRRAEVVFSIVDLRVILKQQFDSFEIAILARCERHGRIDA